MSGTKHLQLARCLYGSKYLLLPAVQHPAVGTYYYDHKALDRCDEDPAPRNDSLAFLIRMDCCKRSASRGPLNAMALLKLLLISLMTTMEGRR